MFGRLGDNLKPIARRRQFFCAASSSLKTMASAARFDRRLRKRQGMSHAVIDEPGEEIGGDDELAPPVMHNYPSRAKRSPGLDTGAPPLKKVMPCCEEQRVRRSSSVLLPPTRRPDRRLAVPAWGIGLLLRGARCERSCTERQRRFSIPSSILVSVSSDTPFEKGASRCSPGTS